MGSIPGIIHIFKLKVLSKWQLLLTLKAAHFDRAKEACWSEPVKSKVLSIHRISMTKLRFLTHPKAKVKCQEPSGTARAWPW